MDRPLVIRSLRAEFGLQQPPMGPSGFGPPPPGYGGGDPNAAREKVKLPAIIMMVCTIVGMVFQVVSFFMNVLGTGVGLANGGANGGNDAFTQLMSGAIGMVGNAVGLIAGGVCIYGFTKMMKLQSRGFRLRGGHHEHDPVHGQLLLAEISGSAFGRSSSSATKTSKPRST